MTCRQSKLTSSSESDCDLPDFTMAEQTIITSLTSLHQKLDAMNEEFSKTKNVVYGDAENNIPGLVHQVGGLATNSDKLLAAHNELKEEHIKLKDDFKILMGVVERQNQQIENLTQKLDKQVARSMRKNIIISGVEENDEEDAMQVAKKFFKDEMSIEPEIAMAHRLGEKVPSAKSPRALVTRLASISEKQRVYQNVSSLKGKKNSKGNVFFVSDQLPESIAEQRRKNSERLKQNKAKPSDQQVQMRIRGGQLYVNNELQRPSVIRPSLDDCINIDPEERKKMDKVKLVRGDQFEQDGGSTFYAYAAKVSTIQEVRRAYRKLSTAHPNATHIMVAYRYAHNSKTYSDYHDDGEHGGGRIMMKTMTDANISGAVVFTVRHYGGRHIGYKRFQFIQNCTRSALYKLYNK